MHETDIKTRHLIFLNKPQLTKQSLKENFTNIRRENISSLYSAL